MRELAKPETFLPVFLEAGKIGVQRFFQCRVPQTDIRSGYIEERCQVKLRLFLGNCSLEGMDVHALLFHHINNPGNIEGSVSDVQTGLKVHFSFLWRIVPYVLFMTFSGITQEHIGRDASVWCPVHAFRVGFRQGVHEFIGYGNSRSHPSSFIDGPEFEIILWA